MRKVPELRFDGFDGEWEEKKLSNIVKINSGRDYKHLSEGKYPVYGTGGLMTYVSEFLSDVDSVGIGRKGTINKPQKLEAPFWTVDTLFYATPIKDYNLDYIYSVFQIINWLKYDESTGLPSLSKTNINNIRIYNAGVQEQEKIGNLFRKLDDLIEIQEGKVAKMRDYKKSMLQKMVPKKDELVPEFRFDGFNGEWLPMFLKDLVYSEYKGKAMVDKLILGGETEYLDTERLNGGSPILVDNDPDTNFDDILILWDGSKAGAIYTKFEGILGSTLRGFKINEGNDSYFIYSFLKMNEDLIEKKYRTPNIPHVVKDFSKVFEIKVPSFEEQQKIGNLFKNIDTQIENEEKLLDSYKMMKKSLLQKMFV